MGAILIIIALAQAYKHNYPKGAKVFVEKCVAHFCAGIPRFVNAEIIWRHFLRKLQLLRLLQLQLYMRSWYLFSVSGYDL